MHNEKEKLAFDFTAFDDSTLGFMLRDARFIADTINAIKEINALLLVSSGYVQNLLERDRQHLMNEIADTILDGFLPVFRQLATHDKVSYLDKRLPIRQDDEHTIRELNEKLDLIMFANPNITFHD